MAAHWTFLVYMAGNNSLTEAASDDLGEMRKVGSSDAVKVLAFVKQESGPARHIVVGTSEATDVVEALAGDVDSGNPQTVVDFVRWGVAKAPAEKYALVLWNHGGGWEPDDFEQLYSEVRRDAAARLDTRETSRLRASPLARAFFTTTVKKVLGQPTAGERAICSDDGSGHSLDTIELGKLLKLVGQAIGHPLDLLGMDACLMSTLEVAFEAAPYATVVVGSEEPEPNAGWCYDQILADLAATPTMDPAALAKVVVDRYVASYKDSPGDWPVTQCALATAQLEQGAAALDRLGNALRTQVRQDYRPVQRAQAKGILQDATDLSLVDLARFCASLLTAANLQDELRAATTAAQAAVTAQPVVLAEGHLGPTTEGYGGVSVYFPAPTESVSKYYRDLRFAKQHRWDEFLRSYQRAVRGT